MAALSNEMKRMLGMVETSYRRNIPLNLMNLNRQQLDRIDMCTQVAKRFQENPLMNVEDFLAVVFKRTPAQIVLDKKIILFIRNLRYGTDDRDTAAFIAESMAKQIMMVGTQTGDPKWIDKGLEKYIKVKQLDQPAPPEDLMSTVEQLPTVFVSDIRYKDPNRESISDEQRRRLLQKWGASEDDISRIIDERKVQIISSDTPAPGSQDQPENH